MIAFTRAQEPYAAWPAGDSVKEPADKGHALTGEEAKRFYQSLIEEGGDGETGSSSTGNTPGRRARRRRPQAAAPSERDGHRLLRCAQEGDLMGLRELLGKKGCNVNFCDAYYWTAIMCASYAGRLDAVRYLLRKGAAWVGVVDTQGRDARDLADQAGHMDVVRELDTFRAQEDRQRTDRSVTGVKHGEFVNIVFNSDLGIPSLMVVWVPEFIWCPSSAADWLMSVGGCVFACLQCPTPRAPLVLRLWYPVQRE